jgi:hypothetical protein
MLARSTTLQHPFGKPITTPLLIPSFSSKGFGFGANRRPEVGELFNVSAEYLTDSVLVSAYDLHHGYVKRPRRVLTEITFVDSGGYETSNFQDLSATFVQPLNPNPWTEEQLREVYETWPNHIPAVFVSFDRRGTVANQANKAHALLKQYPGQLHAFLVKPKTKASKRISVPDVIANVEYLARFHILGITEKELGASTLERMENVAKLRLALDDANLKRLPIHVFGSLDPISVPLYFLAGAEIFDGLTWLRFGYHRGAALYHQNCAARRYGVHHTDDQVKLLTMQQNLVFLSELTNQMRSFLNENDLEKLTNCDVIRKAF